MARFEGVVEKITYRNDENGFTVAQVKLEGGERLAAVGAMPMLLAGERAAFEGELVEHRVFGRGKVLKATPIAGDCIVEIQFERVGVKKTMANYAQLKKITE